ncbi:MAG: biopolymer transporter ExbD [Gammaproteobacteria bacterium]|nr:biopolymer transporter ExbD [Gammaproteobacteria bacterium]MDE1887968.1 biopolymer transporter ExbD [Gammaproteobacteria bacterium]MDE2023450.1 biopolymer transporter ExbD [Gammaproteobacteria bacterium]MDE2139428.1 biopolymer transporter ExbD [Gammaproteobacteria bacterium]MDE2274149.1 biopolymer transporter ExbD [Gammaproteobacteria bacterium]
MASFVEKKKGRIEIINMIDIMLFLLVFFIMITLRMIPATGIASHLPQSSTAVTIERPKIIISLQAHGQIVVENQVMTADQLTSYLLGQDPAHANVTIAGAREATLQDLVIVMDACREAGVTQIGIAAKNID